MKIVVIVGSILLLSTIGQAAREDSRYITVQRPDGKLEIIDREAKVVYAAATPADVTLHLYTKLDQVEGEGDIIPLDGFQGDLDATTFNPAWPSYILIHGWTMDYTSFKRVLPMILKDGVQANVFIVDYPNISKLFYTLAIGQLPAVAQFITEAMNNIKDRYSWDYSTVNLIGHSMGGQMSGFIGANLGGALAQIQALDPAGPLFENKDPSVRLDPTDAKFVQVIHTNGGLLGYRGNLGHADYHPNGGGMNQPECGIDDLLGVCAHFSAVRYYYESVNSAAFVAKSCPTYADFISGACKDNPSTVMGQLAADLSAAGSYYLDTNDEEPYALG